MVVGSQTFPKNLSEYEFAGGIKGEAVPVVRGQMTDLLLPANAEFVVEGEIRPGSIKSEGPFGEFPGYYGRPEAGAPLVDVTAIHFRSQPILTNALMADYPSCEQSGFFAIARAARIWSDLDRLGIPGIQGVYSHPAAAGGFGMTVLSLEDRKSTRLNSSHSSISYAVFCLKKKKNQKKITAKTLTARNKKQPT